MVWGIKKTTVQTKYHCAGKTSSSPSSGHFGIHFFHGSSGTKRHKRLNLSGDCIPRPLRWDCDAIPVGSKHATKGPAPNCPGRRTGSGSNSQSGAARIPHTSPPFIGTLQPRSPPRAQCSYSSTPESSPDIATGHCKSSHGAHPAVTDAQKDCTLLMGIPFSLCRFLSDTPT